VTPATFAAAPSDTLGFILQLGALGALAGTAFAAWRRRDDPEADTWWPPALVGLAGAVIAAVIALVEALL
jgi:hypothetical protein